MSFFRKLEAKNDNKHDFLLIFLYLLFMALALVLAVFFVLFEPGRMPIPMVENILYVLKIALAAALCFYALYCFLKTLSTIMLMIRRKN